MNEKPNFLQSCLVSAITQSIEGMTFEELEVASVPVNISQNSAGKLWVILRIIEPVSGELTLLVSPDYGRVITQQVYGNSEETNSENRVHDVFAEILNTIAGQFMAQLIDSDQAIKLGLPNIGKGKMPEPVAKVASVLLHTEENFITVTISGTDFLNFQKSITE